MYQTGLVRDGAHLPSHEPSAEGLSWSTLFLMYIIMIATNIFDILDEAKVIKIKDLVRLRFKLYKR